MSVPYRIMQGVRALVAFSHHVDYTLPQRYLNEPMLAAFKRLSRSEQLHSIRVLEGVLAQEAQTPADLAVAALMHDSGKVCYPQGVWGKTLAVLIRKLLPPLYQYGSRQDPQRARWAHPFIVAENHPQWGAQILADAGGSSRAVWLVAHHGDNVAALMQHPHAGLLWRLQQADDSN